MSNMWFHRQAAQTAADAACTAGAMDLLVDAQGGATGNQGFTPGTNYSCSSTSTDSVCQYAAKNGYNSNGASPGNSVNVSFPTSVIGVTKPPSTLAPNPFIRVDVAYQFRPPIPLMPFNIIILASPACSSSGGVVTCLFYRHTEMRAMN